MPALRARFAPALPSTALRYDIAQNLTGTQQTQAIENLGLDATTLRNLPDIPEILQDDRAYYVATTGSNSNSGQSSLDPFLTIQHAIDAVYSLDVNGHAVTINVAAGTYSEDLSLNGGLRGDNGFSLSLVGDTVTPSNVTLSSTDTCIFAFGGTVIVRGLKFVNPTGHALYSIYGGVINYMSCEFGDCTAGYHVVAVGTGSTNGWTSNGTNTISGNGIAHIAAFGQGANAGGSAVSTINLVGTPHFSDAFVVCEGGGIDVENITFTGTGATGVRFHAEYMGAIVPTFGSSATYLPGDQPGYIDDTSSYNQWSKISSRSLGTVSSGTITALALSNTDLPSVRQWYYTNGGAHTLPAPTMDGELRILVTNNASAGAITFSGFTTKASPGDALDTTNGHKFLIEIFTINAISTYRVYALQ